jgi:Capsule polysaccharide biosynthesis protein
MKILFYIQRLEDAHMAHAMATTLQQHLGVSDFAAITFRQAPEGSYLLQEAKPLFSAVLSETEMHRHVDQTTLVNPGYIETLEARYGLPFWQYVTQNRFLIMKRANYLHRFGTSHKRNELVAHVQVRFEMTERFLDQFDPDVIIFPVDVGPSSALILERVAKERGIPILVPISSKIGSYHTFIDTVFSQASNLEARFKALQAGQFSSNSDKAHNLINTFRQGHIVPSYVQGLTTDNFEKKMPVKSALNKTSDIIKLRLKKGIFYQKHGEIFNLSQIQYDLDRAAGYYRRWRLRYGDYFQNVVEGEKFFFFPFHVEPELALLLYAPFHTHQSSIMQNVAQSLPWDTCLYVKEHPQAVGTKDMGFYNRVRSTANVRMIYPHVSSRALIAGSNGVVTITGTAGMEAMLMNKPAITLGDVFYTFVPKLVQRAKSIEELPALIRQLDTFEPDETILEAFVTAILDESVEVDPEGLAARLLPLTLEQKRAHPEFITYTEFLIQTITKRLAANSRESVA